MSDRSSAELERDAEIARERMAGTAESIRKKLTAGQLIDEFSDMFTGGDLAGTARNLRAQVRDNPLPIVLVGAGIAWLAFGRGVASRSYASSMSSHGMHRGYGGTSAEKADGGGSMMSSVAHGAKTVARGAETVAQGARTAAQSVSDTVSGAADSLSSTADRLRHGMLTGASKMPRQMQRSASAMADQEPLLIAALGLTLGAVVGAMLPATDLEREQIGPQADRLREGARDALDKGLDSAGRVASRAYDTIKDEADRQGLTPGDSASVGERVGKVVRSAAQAAEDAAREEMGAKPDGGQQRT